LRTRRAAAGSVSVAKQPLPDEMVPVTFCFAIPDSAAMRYLRRQETNMMTERFFGGSPGAVILKLAIASIMIGLVLSVFGFNPNSLYDAILSLGEWIRSLGLDAVNTVLRYLVLGAIIVVPLWLLSRFFSLFGSGPGKKRE
jgi:hypothetical protein